MQRVLAITALTWKAAFRFRLFWVLAGLLLAAVVGLPLLLKDDGTARGFTQILLTYTLSLTTALLVFATLWLACGTVARGAVAGKGAGHPAKRNIRRAGFAERSPPGTGSGHGKDFPRTHPSDAG